MSDHAELVAEISMVEKMSTQDRLKHAKKRRSQQLKKFNQYERHLDKEQNKKSKKNHASKKPQAKKQRTIRITFDSNVMLLEAAARNDVEEVRTLLERGVSPDVTNEDGLTALHQCCIDDSEEMMMLLIEFGANVNARDSELWTPLHAAATCGHIHLCRYLIDKGAELLAVNADGNMPYDICEDETTLDFIENEMARRGVTQELIDEMRLSRENTMLADLKMLAEKSGDLEFRDRYGATPLHIAAANGYIKVVEFLLDHHVNVDLRDDDSWQAIHAAACWGQLAILEMLVHNGADLDAKTKNGESPHDICEEPEMKLRIIELKDEIEHNRASKSSELRHRRSQNTRSSTMSNSASSLYSSNTSLTGDKSPFRPSDHGNWPPSHSASSASVRRTSMRDKSAISWKEAREEAKMMRNSAASDDEEEDANGNKPKGPSQLGNATPKAPSEGTPATDIKSNAPRPEMSENIKPENTPVIIEDMADKVPATNIDDVTISVDQANKHDGDKYPPNVAITRDQLDQEQLDKERERQMNENNTCNSSEVSSRGSTHSQNIHYQAALEPPAPSAPSTTKPPMMRKNTPHVTKDSPGPLHGTLADLKKQRQQQLQTQLQKQKGGGLSPDGVATNGNGSLPQNGHSPSLSTAGDRSAPTTPTDTMLFPPPPSGEPPPRRYISQPCEIVGNEGGKQNCCIIL